MNFTEFLWTTFGAILTLSTFSFLYKDNPFYKIAEHLVVGTSAGYFVIILWYTGLQVKLFDPLASVTWWYIIPIGGKWWYLIPGLLGVMMWFRFSKKLSWISRYPIAFYIGIATGVAVPVEMKNRINLQLFDTISKVPAFDKGFLAGLSDIVIIIGVLTGLFYFFFSKEHKGVFGGVAKTGIYILMIGFGASFGYTVMARISLFIQRVQSLRDWFSQGQAGGAQYMTVVWGTILVIILAILFELIRHLRRDQTKSPA